MNLAYQASIRFISKKYNSFLLLTGKKQFCKKIVILEKLIFLLRNERILKFTNESEELVFFIKFIQKR